jgi:hypothetical protein
MRSIEPKMMGKEVPFLSHLFQSGRILGWNLASQFGDHLAKGQGECIG